MARRRQAARRRRLVAAALTVLLLPVGVVAVAAWAQVPSNERWFLAYVVVCLIVPTATLVALMTGVAKLIRRCVRALARRRDRRMDRHVDTAIGHLRDSPTVPLADWGTQVIRRYERDFAKLSDSYIEDL